MLTMIPPSKPDPKLLALAESGTVNPHAQDVQDAAFLDSEDGKNLLEITQTIALMSMLDKENPDFDGVHCVDCEVELHMVRIQMGRVRCVDCQEWLDHAEKMRAINGREE